MLLLNLSKPQLFVSCILFLFSINYVSSQQLLIDSLTQRKTRFEHKKNFIETDTNYIKTLYILGRSYVYLNKDSTNSLANKALRLSESIDYKKGIAGSKLALGFAQIFEGNFNEGFKNAKHAKEISQKINADTIYLKSLNAIGMGHFMKTDYPKGYMFCQIGRKKAEELNNHEMSVMFNMNIATSFAILNDPKQALPYYEKCLQLLKNKDDDVGLAQVKSNMGYLFIKTKETNKAKIYLKESFEVFKEDLNIPWQAFAQINLGELAILEKKYDSAIALFKSSNKLLNSVYDPMRKAESSLGLSEAYLLKNNLVESETSALKADSIAKSIKFYEGTIRANNLLYKLSKLKGKPTKALVHLEASRYLSDSMKVAENRTKFLMLEAQTNFEQEQSRIEVENSKKLALQQTITYIAILLLVSAAIILFLIRRNVITQKETNKKLININATKDKIFSIIGHDLKTPLTSLNELLELLKEKAISPKDMMQLTPIIQTNIDYSTFSLSNLLSWAQSQMDEIKTNPSHIDISNTINETISVYEVQAIKKDIQILNKVQNGLKGYFDTEHLRIVLRNLLWNAIKYTPSKGTIIFSSEIKSDQIKISVCDTGIGISEEDSTKLLNNLPINSTRGTNNETGTGLGLSICNELLAKNDAKMNIAPNKPKGSCFSILFPILKE